KRPAALWVAPSLACGFVARRSQPHCGGCSLLAPRHRPNWAQQNTNHLGDTTLVRGRGRLAGTVPRAIPAFARNRYGVRGPSFSAELIIGIGGGFRREKQFRLVTLSATVLVTIFELTLVNIKTG